MKLIVAVTQNWGIGQNNALLKSLPEDMAFFRAKTAGAVLLMGRATLDSFPGGRPLKGRTNLVLTRDRAFERPGVTVLHSLQQAAQALEGQSTENVFVIGGASVYAQLLPYCDTAYVTKMELTLPADSFFPNLDEMPGWILTQDGVPAQSGETLYRFCEYRNTRVQPLPGK